MAAVFLLMILVEKGFSSNERFYFDYAVVDHAIKNDSGELQKLMELNELGEKLEHKPVGDFLVQFWWNRCVMNCHDYMSSIITAQKSRLQDDKIKKMIQTQNNQCVSSYIYDNWDEINTTIVDKYDFLERQLSFWEKLKGYLWGPRRT